MSALCPLQRSSRLARERVSGLRIDPKAQCGVVRSWRCTNDHLAQLLVVPEERTFVPQTEAFEEVLIALLDATLQLEHPGLHCVRRR